MATEEMEDICEVSSLQIHLLLWSIVVDKKTFLIVTFKVQFSIQKATIKT